MLQIALTPITDPGTLAERWRALETAAQGGFFRSWSFLGCQFETRFTNPLLLAVTAQGQDLALGLLNRASRRLHVGQTGDPAYDAVFPEHGGLLVRSGSQAVLAPALRAALAVAPLDLPGIDDTQRAACRAAGLTHIRQQRFAPAVDLLALKKPYLETLSANARSQIRRARRLFGPGLHLHRAETLEQAEAFFTAMVALHQASWQRRGQPGAFAAPAMQDFHRTLIGRACPRGEADLLRISSHETPIGYLYNFVHGNRVFCYQSGFAPNASAQEKPGLVSHSLAIEHYAARGLAVYDLLAGAGRYKTTLARGGQRLSWVTLYRKTSAIGLARIAASRLRG